ncbi:MAG: phage portal protein, partial [Cyanobacteria bacterium P01_F01_bin.116]
QGHLLADGDGGLSGESRIQMRQNFELYLRAWKRPIESAISNILNIVLRLLDYTELEAVVQLNITTGKLSSEERQAVISEYQAGLLSKATALAQLDSVDDVDAELALIDEERQAAAATQSTSLPTNPLPRPVDSVNDDDNS